MEKRLGSDRPAPVWRAGRAGAALALVALAVSGCMSLKENKVVQTTPGKVTIRTVVCASNFAANKALAECGPANLFAVDNNRADATAAKKGQLLVGFRVPTGAEGPASFSTKSPAIAFTKSDTYAGELRRLFPPPADQQWIGYISAVGDYDPKGTRVLEMEPEFTLPASATGAPFRWRTVVGFREGGDAAAPVSCPQPDPNVANRCIESPADNRIRTDEVNAVSDFDVLGGATTDRVPGHHRGRAVQAALRRRRQARKAVLLPERADRAAPDGRQDRRSAARDPGRHHPRRGAGARAAEHARGAVHGRASPVRSAPRRSPAPPRARSWSSPCRRRRTSRCPPPGRSASRFSR